MAEEVVEQAKSSRALRLACQILCAYIRKNQLPAADVPTALRQFYGTLVRLTPSLAPTFEPIRPPIPIKKSVTDEYLICLEDGRKMKTLKRHLRAHFGLTPDQYRAKWHLAEDYPMTAPGYAAVRSALAKKTGLGRGSVRPVRRKR